MKKLFVTFVFALVCNFSFANNYEQPTQKDSLGAFREAEICGHICVVTDWEDVQFYIDYYC